MVKKRKVSPAKVLVRYWHGLTILYRPIYFTSFITRLAKSFGLPDSHEYACISHPRDILGEEFFIRIGVLKKGSDGEFIMVYPSHTTEILLPCEQRQLYRLRTLTIKLDPQVEPDFAVTRATRMDEACLSRPAGDNVERGKEASSMDRLESMGIPSPISTPLSLEGDVLQGRTSTTSSTTWALCT